MPREGEPGTLTAMLEQNAVPETGRLKRKDSLPSEDSDEESKREEPEPLDPEMEARLNALDSEQFLRPDYAGPPLGPIPPPSRASSASGASGVSDTEVGVPATSALAKKIASHVNYHRTDQFVNDAMAMYKAANRDEEHKTSPAVRSRQILQVGCADPRIPQKRKQIIIQVDRRVDD
jgi:hypothetical protein